MRILLAEDDKFSRDLLASMLKRWGYEVEEYMDGDSALAALQRADAPKIALLDWNMPAMSGLEVCRRVRSQGLDCHVIIITTAHEYEDLEEIMTAGADDYIQKGGLPQELQFRLRLAETVSTLQEEIKTCRIEKKENEGWWQFAFRKDNE